MKTKRDERQFSLPLMGGRSLNREKPAPIQDGRSSGKARPGPASVPRAVPLDQSDQARRFESLMRRIVKKPPIAITLTDNAYQLLSYQDDRSGVRHVRVARVLLAAPETVWLEIALWVKDSRRNKIFSVGSPSEAFVESDEAKACLSKKRRRRPRTLISAGSVHDLKEIFDRLNARYFDGKCKSRIGWSQLSHKRRSRSIRMGSYLFDDDIILIHPVLDNKRVPDHIVAATIFHEMAHWKLRDRLNENGRRMLHSREFNELMKCFPNNERAEAWINRNIRFLMRRRSEILKELKKGAS